MSNRFSPPRLAERLLGLSVPDSEWRDSIVGDLREEYLDIRRQQGEGAARRWYWRNTVAIGLRGVTLRLGRHSRGALMQTADIETSGSGRGAGFARDLRHAWRTLARRPGTSAVIVITLALALATNSTAYAILDAMVLRPFRFAGVDELLIITSSDPQERFLDRESVSPADFREWRRDATTVTHLSAAEWWDANLSAIDTPEQVAGYQVTSQFFEALDARPILGRTFVPEEETPGNHRRAVIGHALWGRLFNSDPAVIGRTIRLDGEPYEVVGVAPPEFNIPLGAQVWAPLAYTPEQWNNRRSRYLLALARLVPGKTLHDASAEFAAMAERQKREHPDTNATAFNNVVTFTQGMADPGGAPFMALMVAASVLLLLIACANIANLLLARGGERSQELALRLALGASRARLTTQLLIEGALLSAMAVVVALPIAAVWVGLSRGAIPPSVVRFVPGWEYMTLSPTVFWAAAAFGAVATIVFALVPAWQSAGADVASTLRHGARTTTAPRQRLWMRNALAVSQVALTLALLFGTGLLTTAASRALEGDVGFDKRNLLVARLVLPERPYAEPEKRRQFVASVLDRLRVIPAVSQAAMVSDLPYGNSNPGRDFHPEGRDLPAAEVRRVDYRRITPEYFDTMGIRVVAGRGLLQSDRTGTPAVAVISETLAARYWPGADPIGRRFRTARDAAPITVVGVARDIIHEWFQGTPSPTVYRPLAQEAPYQMAFAVRTVGDPMSVAGDLRRAVSAVDPDQPLMSLTSMEHLMEERTSGITYMARALGVVASIALVLAVTGLYSLMAFMVSRRTQEVGVRIALGASRWQVIRLTTRQGLTITAVGLIIGGLTAYGVGRAMESLLFGVVATSTWQLLAIVAGIAAVSAVASYIPARRAATIDPTTALRAE